MKGASNDVDVYEFGGGAETVDTVEMLELVAGWNRVIAAAEAAATCLKAAGWAAGALVVAAPMSGTRLQEQIRRLESGVISIEAFLDVAREVRDALATSAGLYATQELSVSNILAAQTGALAWVRRYAQLFPYAVPIGSVPTSPPPSFAQAVWNSLGSQVQDHMPEGGALRFHIAMWTPLLGTVANPIGFVDTRHGLRSWQEMLPASFLAGTLLWFFGWDRVLGDVKVSVETGMGWRRIVEMKDDQVVAMSPVDPDDDGRPLERADGEALTLDDLVAEMDALGMEAMAEGAGRIGVVRQVAPDGTQSWILLIPGTTDWDPIDTTNPQDLIANAQLFSDRESDIERAIAEALATLPIEPGDSLSGIGHSQGGMVLLELFSDPELVEDYDLTNAITLGSPTAQVEGMTPETQVLALENADDIVPALPGAVQDPSEHVVRAVFDAHEPIEGSGHPHDSAAYRYGLQAVAADGEASAEMLRDFENNALLTQEGVVTTLYTIGIERT